MSVTARREREREARRNRILDAAQRVFYAKGFDGTKMKDVAAEAQLGKGTLYLYFRTKEELILGVALRHQAKLLERFTVIESAAPDGASLLRGLLLEYVDHMSTPRENLRMVLSRWASGQPLDFDSRGGDRMRQNLATILGTLCGAVERGKVDGTMHSDLDPRQTAMTLVAAADGAMMMQLKLDCMKGASVVTEVPSIEACIDLYLQAVTTGDRPLAAAAGGSR